MKERVVSSLQEGWKAEVCVEALNAPRLGKHSSEDMARHAERSRGMCKWLLWILNFL